MLDRTRLTSAVIAASLPSTGAASIAPSRSRKLQPPCVVRVMAVNTSPGGASSTLAAGTPVHELSVVGRRRLECRVSIGKFRVRVGDLLIQ